MGGAAPDRESGTATYRPPHPNDTQEIGVVNVNNRIEHPRPATTPDILTAAADWIEKHGWTRDGTAEHRMGHTLYSAESAILQVATGSPTTFRAVPEPWTSRGEAARDAALDAINACDLSLGSLTTWEYNDAESGVDVVEMLRAVAVHERECADQDAAEHRAGLVVAS